MPLRLKGQELQAEGYIPQPFLGFVLTHAGSDEDEPIWGDAMILGNLQSRGAVFLVLHDDDDRLAGAARSFQAGDARSLGPKDWHVRFAPPAP